MSDHDLSVWEKAMGWRKRKMVESQLNAQYERTLIQVTRNQTLEEVAREFDKMPFGDTSQSFATYVRRMKT